MTEETDRHLQALFAEADEDLADDTFVDGVMTGVDRQVRLVKIRRFAVALAFVFCAFVLAVPLQNLAMAIIQGMATPLVAVQNPFVAQVLLPVNTVAAPLVLAFFAGRMLHRRLFS